MKIKIEYISSNEVRHTHIPGAISHKPQLQRNERVELQYNIVLDL